MNTVVKLGNTAPISTSYVPTDNKEEAIRKEGSGKNTQYLKLEKEDVKGLEEYNGNAVTVIGVPKGRRGLEAVREIVSAYDERHSNDPPEWVEVVQGQKGLAQLIAAHYTYDAHRDGDGNEVEAHECAVGRPGDWKGLEYDFTVKPDLDELKALMMEHWPELEKQIQGLKALKTNAGQDFQARVMADTSSNGTASYAAANYIALSTDGTAPAAGDTTLTSELVGSGLQRAQATYAHTAGTNTYTLTKAFTSSDGTSRTINKIGIFNASSTGTLVFETAVSSPPTLVSGDQLTVTETVTM